MVKGIGGRGGKGGEGDWVADGGLVGVGTG